MTRKQPPPTFRTTDPMSSDRKDDHTPARPRPDAAGQDAGVHPDRRPAVESPADAREQAEAASFAALIDRLTTGQALPPAMTTEERVLVDTAGMVRAAARPVALATERQRALIDGVLERARDRGASKPAQVGIGSSDRVPSRAPGRDQSRPHPGDSGDIVDLGERRRGRYLRALPWAVAMASVAAALLLALWQSRSGPLAPQAPTVVAESAPGLDTVHRSRPADALIGEIPRPRADAARARIDMIYADRLVGYRDLRLRGDRL